MKSLLSRFACCIALLFLSQQIFAQDTTARHGIHQLTWEYGFGKSVFTSTPLLENRVFVNAQPYTMHYWVTTPIPLSKNGSLYLRTGVGPELKTFGLNKILEPVNQQWQLSDFSAGIQYSILQQLFVDVPVLFGMTTHENRRSRSFALEAGALVGLEAYNRVKTLSSDGNAQFVRSQENIGQTSPLQTAAVLRLVTNKKRGNFASGMFVSCSYNFQPVFRSQLNIPVQSYQVEIGFSFSANRL